MAIRTLKQEIINEIDINNLLIKFTPSQIAFTFNITEDYVYKTAKCQRIKKEEKFKKSSIGAWKNSVGRKFLESNFLLESQNKEI